MKKLNAALIAILLAAASAQAQIVFTNLANDWSGWIGVYNSATDTQRVAQQFTTGNAGYILLAINPYFQDVTGSPADGFTMELFSDSGGLPDAFLSSLDGPASPVAGFGNAYATPGGYEVAANTTYWWVASTLSLSNVTNFSIYQTSDLTATSPAGWTGGKSAADSGTGWILDETASTQFSMDATVPEPSTWALFGLGALGILMGLRRKKTA